jgi:hypothetical protein
MATLLGVPEHRLQELAARELKPLKEQKMKTMR